VLLLDVNICVNAFRRESRGQALALEQKATWVTTDRGFARYQGLRLLDPSAH
jgi:predicted nucleic acid-binding protein